MGETCMKHLHTDPIDIGKTERSMSVISHWISYSTYAFDKHKKVLKVH